MADAQFEMKPKASFVSSTWEGIKGYVKGVVAGGIIGIIGGAIGGAVLGFVTGGFGLEAAIATGLMGGAIGGVSLAGIGGVAGAMTGVVRSREANQPTAEDIVNVAKISFAQGVGVGQHLGHEQVRQATKSVTHHQDKIKGERAAMALAEHQIVN